MSSSSINQGIHYPKPSSKHYFLSHFKVIRSCYNKRLCMYTDTLMLFSENYLRCYTTLQVGYLHDIHLKDFLNYENDSYLKQLLTDLGELSHTLVPYWMPKPLPPRNECTGCFAPVPLTPPHCKIIDAYHTSNHELTIEIGQSSGYPKPWR